MAYTPGPAKTPGGTISAAEFNALTGAAATITIKLGSPRTVTGYTPTSSATATMATTVTAQWQAPIAEHLHIFEIT